MNRLQFLQSFIATSFASGVGLPDDRAGKTFSAETITTVSAEEIVPDWLTIWQADVIIPITEADDDRALMILLAHQHRQQSLEILYHGGTWDKREPRTITPILLFEKRNFFATYLLAWCHQRQAARTLQLDKITLYQKRSSN